MYYKNEYYMNEHYKRKYYRIEYYKIEYYKNEYYKGEYYEYTSPVLLLTALLTTGEAPFKSVLEMVTLHSPHLRHSHCKTM